MNNKSLALRLSKLIEKYERMSESFMSWDIRGPMMKQAAKDMREVLESEN